MTNRNPVKQIFITYPKSTCDKNTFRDHLLKFQPDYYKIVEELHKDGTPHLHAIIRFKNKYSKSHILKHFKEIYPNDYKRIDVEPVRSIKNAINYLSKEDKNPLESGEYHDNRSPNNNIRNKFARECGYRDAADMLTQYKKEQELLKITKGVVHAKYMELVRTDEMKNVPYDVKKIIENLFDEKKIVKDDMTKILKHLKIK